MTERTAAHAVSSLSVDEWILGQADRELFVVSVREDGFQVLRSVAWPGAWMGK
jgi:hypothetical protein